MERKTVFSNCRRYRYTLWREWDMFSQSYAVLIGLNPSTADEVKDDPTVRRCIDYAKRWGYGALCMMNLFAFRATDPKVMMKWIKDPVGPENDRWLAEVGKSAAVIVAAWGIHGTHLNRDRSVRSMFEGRLFCLGKTRGGQPGHPLYLRKDAVLYPFA